MEILSRAAQFYMSLHMHMCFDYHQEDRSGFGWKDRRSQQVIKSASDICHREYGGCVVRVIRVQETSYYVICRAEEQGN